MRTIACAQRQTSRSLPKLGGSTTPFLKGHTMEQVHLNNGINGSASTNAAARDKLMGDLKNVIHEAEAWIKDAAQTEHKPDPEVRARFEDSLRTAKTDLLKLQDSMMARGKLAAQSANVYVQDNPWKIIGLSALLRPIIFHGLSCT